MSKLKMHFHWLDPKVSRGFRSGVSLHGHTTHSHESLNMIPEYARQSRTLSLAVRALQSRYREQTGTELDFSRPFFTPPLSASEAFRVEAGQIEQDLNLEALVSLTDHDSIEAPLRLRMFIDESKVPASLEWTVPFLDSVFHIGVHNIPINGVQSLMCDLAATRCHRCQDAGTSCSAVGMLARNHALISMNVADELFARLNDLPHTLVVLNHPLWDMAGIGSDRHRVVLNTFMARFARHIHAIEVNGLRSWKENLATMELAERWKLPAVSGGDRHGCEANAILNLTHQTTFQDFVDEIRTEQRSEIIFMRQYREPLRLRKMRIGLDLLRDYPHHNDGTRRWSDRVYIPWRDRATIKLSEILNDNQPLSLHGAVSFLRLLETRPIQPILRIALSE
jgi:hypothetical protein